jgi:hypothetical protein
MLFENALRENLITGRALLNYVGKVLLNDPDKEIQGLCTSWHGA